MNEHLPAVITALVSALTAIGAGLRWIWLQIQARFERIEAELEKCHKREATSNERRAKHLIVIELLWQEVLHLSPEGENPVLGRAKHLLDELKDLGDPGSKAL